MDVESLVRSAVSSADPARLNAQATLTAVTRVLEAARQVEAAKTPRALAALRRALNDLHIARAALVPSLNELMEAGDRVLDALDARSRHVLK